MYLFNSAEGLLQSTYIVDHCIKYFGIWTSGQPCVFKCVILLKMDFVGSKLINSPPGGGRCLPDPLAGRYPCTPPRVNPRTVSFFRTPPPPPTPPFEILGSAYVALYCILFQRSI